MAPSDQNCHVDDRLLYEWQMWPNKQEKLWMKITCWSWWWWGSLWWTWWVIGKCDKTNRRNPILNCSLLGKMLTCRKLELSECNSSCCHVNLSSSVVQLWPWSLLLPVNICYYFIIQLSPVTATICVTLVLTSLQGLSRAVMLTQAQLWHHMITTLHTFICQET